MMVEVDLGIKRPATLPFAIVEKVLMLMRKVDIYLISDALPPIIQVVLVDCWFSLFVVIIEVYICIIPATLLTITTVDNTGPTQGYLTMFFIGVCKDI